MIKKQLWEQLNLRVDFPLPGGSGNSNDGNTARRSFKCYEKFAEVLQIKTEVIKNFWTILIALSCQLPIDATDFGKLCRETAELYITNYSWYPMSATVHKLLIHSEEIIKSTVLPLGMMAEEGAESRNKINKQDREFHSIKSSRINARRYVL